MLPRRKKRVNLCTEIINDMVRSVISSKKGISLPDMQKQYLGQYPAGIVASCEKAYGLDMSKEPCFIAWPVFLGTSFDEINICAVNFGALTLYNPDDDDFTDNQYVNAALNTLIVTSLRREKNGKMVRYWPTHIDFTNRVESGTIIQSTLSLTSLYKFGFLSAQPTINEVWPDHGQMVNRFRFIIENINWILDLQENYGSYGAAWSYAEECKEAQNDKRITNAILPSQFCYETVMQYYELFTASEENAAIVNELEPDLLMRMWQSCRAFEKWIKCEQREDGGYRRNSNSSGSSFAYSCCGMLAYAYEDTKDSTVLNKLIVYLIKNYNKFNLSLGDVVDSYKYKYEASEYSGYVNDAYEIFPESLFITNSCKNIDNGTFDILKPRYRIAIRTMNYIAYGKIFKRLNTIDIENAGKHTVVEGRQEMLAHKYPIYALYYSKKCFEKLRNNDLLPRKERKKYISVPLDLSPRVIGLIILLLLAVGISYYINAADTIITIVLGFASFIAPIVGHLLFGDDNNFSKK